MFRALAIALCVTLSGCAFTVYDVKTDYKYGGPVASQLASKRLSVGSFSDERGVQNPKMIMNMTNLNGDTTSGGWQAEKPISELLKDGVTQGLTRAGVRMQSSFAPFEINAQLLDFNVKTIMGMWEGSLEGRMTVKFQLKDTRDGKIAWQDTFVGSSQVKGDEGAVGVLKATLDSVITKLLADGYFQQKLAE